MAYLTYGPLAGTLDPTTDAHATFTSAGGDIGAAVAALGDIGGAGYGGLVLSDPGDDTAATDAGALHVWVGGGR